MSTLPEQRPLKAVLWRVMTGICFIGVQATVKHLGPGIPPAESTAWLEKTMLPYYPLGVFKTPESGSREPLPLDL